MIPAAPLVSRRYHFLVQSSGPDLLCWRGPGTDKNVCGKPNPYLVFDRANQVNRSYVSNKATDTHVQSSGAFRGGRDAVARLSQGAATLFQLEVVAMTNDSSPQVRLILCDNEGMGRITVGLEAFFEFSFSLAEELQDLVAQHEEFVHLRAQRDVPRLRTV
jgi:hypothetical protein